MAYVITALCIGTKDASCVDVCPVDCIDSTAAEPQYYIDPDVCIDCGACVPVCPVEAIFPEFEVPAAYRADVEKNRTWFQVFQRSN